MLVPLETKIKRSEIEELYTPMANDLIALFKLIQEDIEIILSDGIDEGLTPEEVIRKIEKLFK